MNIEQVKSFIRWMQATIGPILISHGYVSSGTLEMVAGAMISLAPLAWSMFAHTENNAIAVVNTIAMKPDTPVKALLMEPTVAGRDLSYSLPGNTAVIAGTPNAMAVASSG